MKAINYRLWLALMLTSTIPLIYSTTRIYFLGTLPDPSAFSVAAQVAWLNVGYEVLQEALIVPLAFILGQVINNNDALNKRLAVILAAVGTTYAAVTAGVLLYTPQLVASMQQTSQLVEQTVGYIRLESIALFISCLYSLCLLVWVLKNQTARLYLFLIVQMLLTVMCDSLLVSQLPFSLQLGVYGAALSNIIVNSLLSAIALGYFYRQGFRFKLNLHRAPNRWLKQWFSVGWKSGLESFVRNTAFIVMVLQLINQVEQAGTFWLANHFIWGWLLLPVLTLGQLIKQDAAVHGGLSSARMRSYLWLTAVVLLLWLITAPLWNTFIGTVMGVSDSDSVTQLVLALISFYVLFCFSNAIDSYFYGIGHTGLILFKSLLVNCVFYGSAYVLYQMGIFVPTLESIIWMFGTGFVLGAGLTWLLYAWHRRQPAFLPITPERRETV